MDDVTIDFSKIKSFFTGKSGKGSKFIPYLLLLIPLFLCLFLRMQPAYLPITDQWAETSVRNFYSNQIKSQITSEINSQYAFLPATERDALIKNMIDEQLDEFISTKRAEYDVQVTELSNQFKSQLRDEDGQTYLIAIDPYAHYRQSKNLHENGFFGDEIRNGTPWNTHMLAPNGRSAKAHLHHYVGVYVFNILNFFNKDINYMGAFFYIPVIFSLITVIPAFFIGRRYGGNLGGLFAAIMIAIHPAFLTRTAGGFSDTDVYNVMFPLFIAWFILIAFETKNTKSRYIFGALSGLVTGIYAFTWTGWWYVFDFILGTLVLYIIYRFLIGKKNEYKSTLTILATFILSSALFVSLFKGFGSFMNFLGGPLRFMVIQQASHASLWPNVYTTVAELNAASLKAIINNIGGAFLLVIALLGIVFALLSKRKFKKSDYIVMSFSVIWYVVVISMVSVINQMNNGRFIFLIVLSVPIALGVYYAIKEKKVVDFKIAILLVLWFLGTLYAATNGIRFVMLLVPAFSIAIGIFVGRVFNFLHIWVSKDMKINSLLSKVVLILLLALILVQPLSTATKTATNEIPSMNDAWYNALTAIKEDSKEDAIINSWWDFGHWFKAIADRAVTFDGASQNRPQAHWIGRTLLTDNETEAIAILRMLDCGGNDAFEILDAEINDIILSVETIKEIILLDESSAKEALLELVDDSHAERILKKTHCDPPENYFIASEDMIGKAGVWAHFGSWNFDRAWMWINTRKSNDGTKMIMDKFGYDEEKAEELFYKVESLQEGRDANTWISPWPGYVTGVSGCSNQGSDFAPLLVCNNGVMINMTGQISALLSLDQGMAVPDSIVYPVDGGLEKVVFEEKNKVPYSIALLPTGNGKFSTIVMDKALATSMFTRMFFYGGTGLRHFELFNTQNSFTGESIYVYKVNWDGVDPIRIQGEVRASHILVETEAEADEIYQKAIDGASFEELAINHSIDSAPGGDLGYFGTGVMINTFEEAVAVMEIGEISKPLQTQFGWHVIKLTDIRGSSPDVSSASMEPITEVSSAPEVETASNESVVNSSEDTLETTPNDGVVIVS